MRFIQFYFALPLAMIILSVTLVPFFYNARVYTAYEYLEKRFDARVRSITSLLFLISRGLSVRRDHFRAGRRAVAGAGLEHRGDVRRHLPAGHRVHDVRRRAGRHLDRRQDHDAHRGRAHRHDRGGHSRACPTASASRTAWPWRPTPDGCAHSISRSISRTRGRSGRARSRRCSCSAPYFGADQSQVQRYLTARSLDEARRSLLVSAYWKIPLQVIVLLVGVLVFVFYTFNPGPLLYSRDARERMQQGAAAGDYAKLQSEFDATYEARRAAALEFTKARQSGDAAGIAAASTSLRDKEAALAGCPDPRARPGPQQQRRQGVHGRCVVHGRELALTVTEKSTKPKKGIVDSRAFPGWPEGRPCLPTAGQARWPPSRIGPDHPVGKDQVEVGNLFQHALGGKGFRLPVRAPGRPQAMCPRTPGWLEKYSYT